MSDLVDILQKLSGATLSTLLVSILYGSYKGVWIWGSECSRREAILIADRDNWKAQAAEYKYMALSAVGLAEKSVSIVKTR